MWSVEKKLKTLYRSSFVEQITRDISKLVSKKTDVPFSIEQLDDIHDMLKNRLELIFIFKRHPESYELLLNGDKLPKEVNEELQVFLTGNKNGIKAYSYLRGIRLKGGNKAGKYSDIGNYYKEVDEKLKTFQDYHRKISENLEEYINELNEKKRKRNEAKRNTKKYKDFSLEDLHRSLEEMGIE